MHIGSAPPINTLVIITDNGERVTVSSEQADQSLLNWIDVLIFINQEMEKAIGNFKNSRIFLTEQVHNQSDHQ